MDNNEYRAYQAGEVDDAYEILDEQLKVILTEALISTPLADYSERIAEWLREYHGEDLVSELGIE